MDAQEILIEKLKYWFGEDLCRTCECLHVCLLIGLDGREDLKVSAEAYKVPREQMHGCLGCIPCPPVEALTAYYIRRARAIRP